MTDSNYTAVAMLIDRSGSMQFIRTDAEGAVNAFVEEQRKQPGRCTVRISQFDTEYETVHESLDVNDAPAFVLSPRGGTALNDGIGRLIVEFGEELAALPEEQRPANVVVGIVTDGMENSSREWTAAKVKELVEQQTNDYNWKFIFLAAGQDAVLTGKDYGFDPGLSITYNASGAGTQSVISTYSGLVTNIRAGRKAEVTEEDRKNAVQ